jgi:hypothetical protein
MKFKFSAISILSMVCVSFVPLFGQVSPQIQGYRDDAHGAYVNRREGIMDGNNVRTLYYNNGEVGQWPYSPSLEWPAQSGHQYLDGVCVLVGAQVRAPGNNQIIHPLETSYREEMPKDPVDGLIWGFEPVPGYMNMNKNVARTPAINRDSMSFPTVWPSALGKTPDWNGYWYGYFGRGVNNADFETFFVMDDSKDGKYKRPPYNYYPLASDSTRGGLGLRVEVRGFQWSHVLAEDVIFWHYDIVNLSDTKYDSACFGFYSDPGVGGPSSGNDDANFSTVLDLCYAWDHVGKGEPKYGNWNTGYYGYAYLESPGNSENHIDDDEDGLIDEKRDDGIDNNHNWVGYEDVNKNGKWDKGEPLNDDLGADGVGPFDPQYFGSDAGEGDGLPTHGEPNFDETDKDESDQIGLTAVSLTPLADKGPNGVWPKNNEVVWRKMTGGFVDTGIVNSNISIVFSSGPFPLNKGARERFSMALIMGNDLDQVVFNKTTVQAIYNAYYNFSAPPLTPHLTAVAGDKQVFLYWDNIAENSYDRFLRRKDFEGYMVLRSQESKFTDVKTITDSKGQPKYWKPIAQFDVIDTINGPDPIGINGAHFWRGDNSGLQHSYIDKDVKNGVKYYYAVVSYDQGDPFYGKTGLQPTESPKIMIEDVSGKLKFVDINCAVVVPSAAAAGYVPPQIEGSLDRVSNGIGTSSISIQIVNPNTILTGTEYKVQFDSSGKFPEYGTKSVSVIRKLGSALDTVIRNVKIADVSGNKTSTPFDGMTIAVKNDTKIVLDTMGWTVGKPSVYVWVVPDSSAPSLNKLWPSDYEIKYFAATVDTSNGDLDPVVYPPIPVNFTITNTTFGHRNKFIIQDNDGNSKLSSGDFIKVLEFTNNNADLWIPWKISYFYLDTLSLPKAGDKFIFKTKRPFFTGDYFSIKTKASRTDVGLAKDQLSGISVVPNPYVGYASWEPKNTYASGRGDRKIDFVNLPQQCTIRIYTVAGSLVKTLVKESAATNGSLSWNLISEDGTDVAYGLYIFHVDAPNVGTYIGKFALIK